MQTYIRHHVQGQRPDGISALPALIVLSAIMASV